MKCCDHCKETNNLQTQEICEECLQWTRAIIRFGIVTDGLVLRCPCGGKLTYEAGFLFFQREGLNCGSCKKKWFLSRV